MAERRNPYFILGLDHGASREQAQVAFARVSRRLRRDPQAPYRIEDATWALHQIEHAAGDPDADLRTYRVPANPAVYDYPEADGLLRPPPRNLPRRSGPSDSEVLRLRAEVVREVTVDVLAALVAELCPPAGDGRRTAG